MGTNEYSQPASKSSWDSQDFGDVNMVVKMAHFHKSSRPQWVNQTITSFKLKYFKSVSVQPKMLQGTIFSVLYGIVPQYHKIM